MKLIAPVLLSVLVLLTSSAIADSTLAKFKGGIGVIPVSSGQGTAATATVVNRNIVRGVQPPGQIWTIRDLDATVKTDGRIRVKGRGLLLAGGDNIGFTLGLRVFATLICETAAPFTQRNTLMLREGTRLREYSCLENNLDPKLYDKLLVDPSTFIRKPQ